MCEPDPQFTDKNKDPAAGHPSHIAVLKASRWVDDPYGEATELSGWAYAEVACGDRAAVSFRVPTLDDEPESYMSADDAEAFGTMLIRMAGVARAHLASQAD